jgi:DNA-binding XRE family transcriptional regulator
MPARPQELVVVDGETASCAGCGCTALRAAVDTLTVTLLRSDVTASVPVPARRCTRCSGVHVDRAAFGRSRLALCKALADAGVHTGEVLRLMRKALDLRACDLARLLDLTPETVSHWETGKKAPNRCAFVALAAMVEDTLAGRTTTRDRLAVMADGASFPRSLQVTLQKK